ncbi:MAG TPA: CvpA family protein, partial [Planctomycetota bacterium]|nr:CvpA family protein [Planctomycetota bacterium]
MADAAFALILVAGLVSGLRRGFVKAVIAIAGIVVASVVALYAYGLAGPLVAEEAGVPADVGYLVGGVGAWLLAYFLFILLGRLAWKSARGKGPLSRVEEA